MSPDHEPACRGLLFGRDFKAHSEAAELLAASLPAEIPAIISCLDLLLLWVCARICDANMSCLLKVLGLARSLLLQLREQVRNVNWDNTSLPVCCGTGALLCMGLVTCGHTWACMPQLASRWGDMCIGQQQHTS